MKDFFIKYRIVLITSFIGMIAGFFYWKYIGCLSGTCRIKSVWYMSTLYGGILGYLAGDITLGLIKWLKKRKEERER